MCLIQTQLLYCVALLHVSMSDYCIAFTVRKLWIGTPVFDFDAACTALINVLPIAALQLISFHPLSHFTLHITFLLIILHHTSAHLFCFLFTIVTNYHDLTTPKQLQQRHLSVHLILSILGVSCVTVWFHLTLECLSLYPVSRVWGRLS